MLIQTDPKVGDGVERLISAGAIMVVGYCTPKLFMYSRV